jgi:hypothetical protein
MILKPGVLWIFPLPRARPGFPFALLGGPGPYRPEPKRASALRSSKKFARWLAS